MKRPDINNYHYRLNKGQSENKITHVSYLDDLEKYIKHLESKVDNFVLANVRLSLPDDAKHFAEWMDIVCFRDGRFEWKYKADNYTKKYTTTQMYVEWLQLTSNEA